MEPVTAAAIAGAVVAEIAKSLGGQVGKQIGEAGGKLLGRVRARFAHEPKAANALQAFESDPEEEAFSSVVKKHLERIMTEDSEFRQQLLTEMQQGNVQVVTGSGEARLTDIVQGARGAGNQQTVSAQDKAQITGVKQHTES